MPEPAKPTAKELQGLSEQDLVDCIASGDRVAMREFFGRYQATLRRRVGRLMGPSVRRLHDSSDLMSSVGRRLDELAVKLKVRASKPEELMAMINAVSRNTLNRRIRDAIREDQAISNAEPLGSPQIPRPMAGQLEQLAKAIETLSDSDRHVIELYLRHGTAESIAQSLGISNEAARQQLSRARKRLAKQMGEPR